jgi:hypothetical protein
VELKRGRRGGQDWGGQRIFLRKGLGNCNSENRHYLHQAWGRGIYEFWATLALCPCCEGAQWREEAQLQAWAMMGVAAGAGNRGGSREL